MAEDKEEMVMGGTYNGALMGTRVGWDKRERGVAGGERINHKIALFLFISKRISGPTPVYAVHQAKGRGVRKGVLIPRSHFVLIDSATDDVIKWMGREVAMGLICNVMGFKHKIFYNE